MRSSWSLATKLVAMGATFLALALASISLTLWVTWNLEGGAAAVNEAGRMRMQTWRLAAASQGGETAANVGALVAEFDASLRLLRSGDAERPLFLPRESAVDTRFAEVERLWGQRKDRWRSGQAETPAQANADAAAFVEAIDTLVSAIEQELSRLTAILNLFQFIMMAMAILGAVAMLYTGNLYVISPMAQLQRGLTRVESGDFATRIDVDTADEFGRVAASFNRMAGTLHSLYEGLETKVRTKTRHIEAQHQRLTALYEVSAFLAEAGTIEDMARGFARRVREIMKADAATVRWADESNQRYLMLASDCFPAALRAEERSVAAGACACGSLQPDNGTRVITISRADSTAAATVLPCAREGYQSIVRVPIRLQHRLLGELNLFFRSEVQLSDEERELVDALASHLASALEGLRAAALEREAAVGEERALLARELHDSIAQSLSFLKIQVQLLRTAIQRGNAPRIQSVLDELDAGLRESVNEVRELLVHFRTRTNSDHIERALQETLQKFQHQTGLPTRLDARGDGLPLPPDVQVQVLHVIQEALSNVRKHAGATHVSLEIERAPRWRFLVRDNGAGFDAKASPGETHVGLKIMRERAVRIGAEVAIESAIGTGTCVGLTLPEHPVALSGNVATAGIPGTATALN